MHSRNIIKKYHIRYFCSTILFSIKRNLIPEDELHYLTHHYFHIAEPAFDELKDYSCLV